MNDLKALDKRIESKTDAIAAERENEDIILANLGQALYEARPPKLPEGPLDEVGRISGMIRDGENSLRRLLADEDRRLSLQEEKKTLNVEYRNLRNREEAAFDELGRAAWDLWKSGRQFGDGMESALDDLIRAEQRLHAVEDAVYKNESEQSGRGAALLARGKALLLAGRKKTASVALDRLWGKAGRSIFDAVAGDVFTDTPAAVPMATLKALDDRGKEIDERLAAISTEREVLEASLEDLPGKGGVKRRVSVIESTLEENRSALDDAFRALGRSWLETKPGVPDTPELKERRKELEAVRDRIAALESDIESLSAHKKYVIAESARESMARKVIDLDQAVKERQAALKSAKKELASAEKECEALKTALPPMPAED